MSTYLGYSSPDYGDAPCTPPEEFDPPQNSDDSGVNNTNSPYAPPESQILDKQQSIAPPTYDSSPISANSDGTNDKQLDSAPPNYQQTAQIPQYVDLTNNDAMDTLNNLELPQTDSSSSCPRDFSTTPQPQSDHFDYAFCSLTPWKTIDLHLPIAPTQYLGKTHLSNRTLHTGVSGPNSEKGSETLPARVTNMETMMNPSLAAHEIAQLRNLQQQASILPLNARFNDSKYDDRWKLENPHALYGTCSALHFYFTGCSPEFPGFLVGIQQEFRTATSKVYVEYGYTLENVKQEYGQNVNISPNVSVESFTCEDYDFIDQIDVLSSSYGILAVRLFTANGQKTRLIFNRQYVNPSSTDQQHYQDFSQIEEFRLESLPLIPNYFPSSAGKFGALCYFSTFSSVISNQVARILNIHDRNQYAPIKQFIGGLRCYITHPIYKKEINNSAAAAIISPSPASDIYTSASNSNANGPNSDDYIPPTTMSPLSVASTYSPPSGSSTKSSSSSRNSSDESCGCDNMEHNDWYPGFLLPATINFVTLIAMGVIGLIFGFSIVSRTTETGGLPECLQYRSNSIQNLISFFVALVFAAAIGVFIFIMLILQCCGNTQESQPHTVQRIFYFVFMGIGIICAAVGLWGISSIDSVCLKSGERAVSYLIHGLTIYTPLVYAVACGLNRKRKRWWTEIFFVEWVLGVVAIACSVFALFVMLACSVKR